MNIPKLLRLAVILLATQLLGCSYQQQLEEVAKNWCMTIRASQVIPVYPLTEDLEPGDVFLVQIPVPRQAEQYKQKGFLPLDMHMVRLDIPRKEFLEFYDGFYGLDPNYRKNVPPHIWQDKPKSNNERTTSKESTTSKENSEPNDSSEPNKINEPNDLNKPPDKNGQKRAQPAGHRDPTNWSKAPRAGFPSYTFEVKRGIAGAAALPIKGIPVAMSLLGADKATGSVTIKDSYTYGIPYHNIVQILTDWARDNKNLLNSIRQGVIDAEPFPDQLWRFLSSPFVGHRERTIYLRIISRVYLTGSLTVSITNTSAAAVKAATKSFKDMNLPSLSSAKDVNDNTKRLKALNESLALKHLDTEQDAAGVGAAINVTWATFRSISLDERFDRPLVIGYLAFDFPVLEGGGLGTPIATLNQISKAPVTTKIKPLSSKAGPLLPHLLGEIDSGLRKIAELGTEPDANSHRDSLNKAAKIILFKHGIAAHRYDFIVDDRSLKKHLIDFQCSEYDSSILIQLLANYRDSATEINQAVLAIKEKKKIKFMEETTKDNYRCICILKKGSKIEMDGKDHDCIRWLERQRDYYVSLKRELANEIQNSLQIIDAVNYYFSLISSNK